MATDTVRNDRYVLLGNGTEPSRDDLIAEVLRACSDLRHCGDAAGALRLLTAAVRRIAPEAAVWAAHRTSGQAVSEAASYGLARVANHSGQPAVFDAAKMLERLSGRLADGLPPFRIEASETPFPGVFDPDDVPPDVSVFPMSASGSCGALVVTIPLTHLSAIDRALIAMLCAEATLALDLIEARTAAQHADALNSALTQLTASYADPDGVLQTIVRSAAALLGTDAAFVMLKGDDPDVLAVRTAYGITNRRFFQATSRIDEWLPGAAIRTRQVVCVRDLHEFQQARYSRPEGLRSVMCAPMFFDDQLVGVLLAAHRDVRDASMQQRRIMAALANAAALAIGNARLYAERQESIRQLGDLNQLLAVRSSALERTLQFQRDLTSLVLNGDGLDAIVGAVTATLGRRVSVFDRDVVLIQASSDGGDLAGFDVPSLRAAVGGFELSPGHRGLRRVTLDQDRHVVVVPLYLAGEPTAYVVIDEAAHSLDTTELALAEAGVTAIGLELLRDHACAQTEERLTGGLFQALLADEDVDEATLIRRASYLGLDLSGHNAVIAVKQPAGGLHRVTSLESFVRRAVRREEASAAVFIRDETVFVVLSASEVFTRKSVRSACSAIRRELRASPHGGTLIASAGPHAGVPGVRQALQESHYGLHVLGLQARADATLDFSELGVWALLGGVRHRDQLTGFAEGVLGPLLAHDAERGSELVTTVRELARCNYHCRTAAEALFAHVNTIRYRMSRITELSGLDLTQADHRLQVDLALRILDVIGPNGID